MELHEGFRVLDDHLGRERTGLDVAALLQLQQVPAVAEDRAFGEALQDPLRHATEPPSRYAVPESRAARSAQGTSHSTPGHARSDVRANIDATRIDTSRLGTAASTARPKTAETVFRDRDHRA